MRPALFLLYSHGQLSSTEMAYQGSLLVLGVNKRVSITIHTSQPKRPEIWRKNCILAASSDSPCVPPILDLVATSLWGIPICQLSATEIGKLCFSSQCTSFQLSVLGSDCLFCSSSVTHMRQLTSLTWQIKMSICLNDLNQIMEAVQWMPQCGQETLGLYDQEQRKGRGKQFRKGTRLQTPQMGALLPMKLSYVRTMFSSDYSG